jgi:hypothetical protein
MRRHTLLSTALLLASMASASAQEQTRTVRMIWGPHLPRANGVTTDYAATCGTVDYALKVSREAKSVILTRSNGPDVDLSATTVGARLLDEDVLVHVGFNCPMNALNIFLKGVKLADLGAPTGFRDSISLHADGKLGPSEAREERLDELATPRTGTGEIPSAAERDRRACEAVLAKSSVQ